MASISKILELKDRFSSVIDRWVSGLQTASDSSDTFDDRLKRLTLSEDRVTAANAQWLVELQKSAEKGLGAADSLAVYEDAFHSVVNSMTSSPELIDNAMSEWSSYIELAGYKWTDAAEGIDKDILLINNSLEKLKQNGLIELEQKSESLISKLKRGFSDLVKTSSKLDPVSKNLLRIGASFLTARKLVSMFRNAVERAPDSMLKPYNDLKNTFRDFLDMPMVAALSQMTGALQALNEKLQSPAGQKFLAGLAGIGVVIGSLVGVLLNAISKLVDFVANNFDTAMLIAAGVLAFFAGKMLLTAAATLIANAPLLLFIAIIAAAAFALSQMGITAGDVFGFIGELAGGLFTLSYNLIAQLWNAIASFAEFFANVWHDPIGEVKILFLNLADSILGVLETIAGALDAIFGSNLARSVSDWRLALQSAVDDLTGSENRITVARMDELVYNDVIQSWGEKARGLGDTLTSFDPTAIELKAIDANTKSAASSLNSINEALKDAELAALLDVAEQKFVSQVNLTAQTPVITVNGANTGNTQRDRQNLANTIRDILLEMAAAGSMQVSDPYVGG